MDFFSSRRSFRLFSQDDMGCVSLPRKKKNNNENNNNNNAMRVKTKKDSNGY